MLIVATNTSFTATIVYNSCLSFEGLTLSTDVDLIVFFAIDCQPFKFHPPYHSPCHDFSHSFLGGGVLYALPGHANTNHWWYLLCRWRNMRDLSSKQRSSQHAAHKNWTPLPESKRVTRISKLASKGLNWINTQNATTLLFMVVYAPSSLVYWEALLRPLVMNAAPFLCKEWHVKGHGLIPTRVVFLLVVICFSLVIRMSINNY